MGDQANHRLDVPIPFRPERAMGHGASTLARPPSPGAAGPGPEDFLGKKTEFDLPKIGMWANNHGKFTNKRLGVHELPRGIWWVFMVI